MQGSIFFLGGKAKNTQLTWLEPGTQLGDCSGTSGFAPSVSGEKGSITAAGLAMLVFCTFRGEGLTARTNFLSLWEWPWTIFPRFQKSRKGLQLLRSYVAHTCWCGINWKIQLSLYTQTLFSNKGSECYVFKLIFPFNYFSLFTFLQAVI